MCPSFFYLVCTSFLVWSLQNIWKLAKLVLKHEEPSSVKCLQVFNSSKYLINGLGSYLLWTPIMWSFYLPLQMTGQMRKPTKHVGSPLIGESGSPWWPIRRWVQWPSRWTLLGSRMGSHQSSASLSDNFSAACRPQSADHPNNKAFVSSAWEKGRMQYAR